MYVCLICMNKKYTLLHLLRSNEMFKKICFFVLCVAMMCNCIGQSCIYAHSGSEVSNKNNKQLQRQDIVHLIPYDRDKKLSSLEVQCLKDIVRDIEGDGYYVIPDDYVAGTSNHQKPNLRPGNAPIIHGQMTPEQKEYTKELQNEVRSKLFTSEMQERLWQKFKKFVMKDKKSEGICRRDLSVYLGNNKTLLSTKEDRSKRFSTLDRANQRDVEKLIKQMSVNVIGRELMYRLIAKHRAIDMSVRSIAAIASQTDICSLQRKYVESDLGWYCDVLEKIRDDKKSSPDSHKLVGMLSVLAKLDTHTRDGNSHTGMPDEAPVQVCISEFQNMLMTYSIKQYDLRSINQQQIQIDTLRDMFKSVVKDVYDIRKMMIGYKDKHGEIIKYETDKCIEELSKILDKITRIDANDSQDTNFDEGTSKLLYTMFNDQDDEEVDDIDYSHDCINDEQVASIDANNEDHSASLNDDVREGKNNDLIQIEKLQDLAIKYLNNLQDDNDKYKLLQSVIHDLYEIYNQYIKSKEHEKDGRYKTLYAVHDVVQKAEGMSRMAISALHRNESVQQLEDYVKKVLHMLDVLTEDIEHHKAVLISENILSQSEIDMLYNCQDALQKMQKDVHDNDYRHILEKIHQHVLSVVAIIPKAMKYERDKMQYKDCLREISNSISGALSDKCVQSNKKSLVLIGDLKKMQDMAQKQAREFINDIEQKSITYNLLIDTMKNVEESAQVIIDKISVSEIQKEIQKKIEDLNKSLIQMQKDNLLEKTRSASEIQKSVSEIQKSVSGIQKKIKDLDKLPIQLKKDNLLEKISSAIKDIRDIKEYVYDCDDEYKIIQSTLDKLCKTLQQYRYYILGTDSISQYGSICELDMNAALNSVYAIDMINKEKVLLISRRDDLLRKIEQYKLSVQSAKQKLDTLLESGQKYKIELYESLLGTSNKSFAECSERLQNGPQKIEKYMNRVRGVLSKCIDDKEKVDNFMDQLGQLASEDTKQLANQANKKEEMLQGVIQSMTNIFTKYNEKGKSIQSVDSDSFDLGKMVDGLQSDLGAVLQGTYSLVVVADVARINECITCSMQESDPIKIINNVKQMIAGIQSSYIRSDLQKMYDRYTRHQFKTIINDFNRTLSKQNPIMPIMQFMKKTLDTTGLIDIDSDGKDVIRATINQFESLPQLYKEQQAITFMLSKLDDLLYSIEISKGDLDVEVESIDELLTKYRDKISHIHLDTNVYDALEAIKVKCGQYRCGDNCDNTDTNGQEKSVTKDGIIASVQELYGMIQDRRVKIMSEISGRDKVHERFHELRCLLESMLAPQLNLDDASKKINALLEKYSYCASCTNIDKNKVLATIKDKCVQYVNMVNVCKNGKQDIAREIQLLRDNIKKRGTETKSILTETQSILNGSISDIEMSALYKEQQAITFMLSKLDDLLYSIEISKYNLDDDIESIDELLTTYKDKISVIQLDGCQDRSAQLSLEVIKKQCDQYMLNVNVIQSQKADIMTNVQALHNKNTNAGDLASAFIAFITRLSDEYMKYIDADCKKDTSEDIGSEVKKVIDQVKKVIDQYVQRDKGKDYIRALCHQLSLDIDKYIDSRSEIIDKLRRQYEYGIDYKTNYILTSSLHSMSDKLIRIILQQPVRFCVDKCTTTSSDVDNKCARDMKTTTSSDAVIYTQCINALVQRIKNARSEGKLSFLVINDIKSGIRSSQATFHDTKFAVSVENNGIDLYHLDVNNMSQGESEGCAQLFKLQAYSILFHELCHYLHQFEFSVPSYEYRYNSNTTFIGEFLHNNDASYQIHINDIKEEIHAMKDVLFSDTVNTNEEMVRSGRLISMMLHPYIKKMVAIVKQSLKERNTTLESVEVADQMLSLGTERTNKERQSAERKCECSALLYTCCSLLMSYYMERGDIKHATEQLRKCVEHMQILIPYIEAEEGRLNRGDIQKLKQDFGLQAFQKAWSNAEEILTMTGVRHNQVKGDSAKSKNDADQCLYFDRLNETSFNMASDNADHHIIRTGHSRTYYMPSKLFKTLVYYNDRSNMDAILEQCTELSNNA